MKVLTDNQYYSEIANVIREQNGTNNTYKPPQMVNALKNLFYEEVEGVPPISFNGIGEDLLDYRIYGANGGVGDKTDNLWNEKAATDTDKYVNANGNMAIGASSDRFLYLKVNVSPSTNYVFKWTENFFGTDDNTAYIRISEYTQGNRFIRRVLCNCSEQTQKAFSFTTDSNTSYIDVRIDSATSIRGQHLNGVMLIVGTSIPETYEPYGYKIPIISDAENLFDKNAITAGYAISQNGNITANASFAYTDFIDVESNKTYIIKGLMTTNQLWTLRIHGYNAAGDWISQIYTTTINLQTPITVIFTTTENIRKLRLSIGIVNRQNLNLLKVVSESKTTILYLDEPLNEGESISMSDTGISIPTINGINILTVDTEIQPSKVYVKARKESSYENAMRQMYEETKAELDEYKAQYGELEEGGD